MNKLSFPDIAYIQNHALYLLQKIETIEKNYEQHIKGSHTSTVEKQIQFIQSKNISINLISYPTNMGKGYALRQGVEASKAEYIVYTDVDFPFTDQSLLDVMNELVKNQADVIAGFRNENYYENKMSWFRKMLSKSFRFFLKNIFYIKYML